MLISEDKKINQLKKLYFESTFSVFKQLQFVVLQAV